MYSRIEVAHRTLEKQRQERCGQGATLAAAEAGGGGGQHEASSGDADGAALGLGHSTEPPTNGPHRYGDTAQAAASGRQEDGVMCDELAADEEFAEAMQEVGGGMRGGGWGLRVGLLWRWLVWPGMQHELL